MKQPIFIDNSFEYEYELLDGVHTLYYSPEHPWSLDTRGTVALRVKDDGEEYVFFCGVFSSGCKILMINTPSFKSFIFESICFSNLSWLKIIGIFILKVPSLSQHNKACSVLLCRQQIPSCLILALDQVKYFLSISFQVLLSRTYSGF